MTSVVGILNMSGVALAADSAVTRKRDRSFGDEVRRITKVTKNGNKMIRLSDAVPVAVMITGNAEFLRAPWDVIARRYRQKRGGIPHATVEDVAEDFFRFVSDTPALWDDTAAIGFFRTAMQETYKSLTKWLFNTKRDGEGRLVRPDRFRDEFIQSVRIRMKKIGGREVCRQFSEYTLEDFRSSYSMHVSRFLRGDGIQEDVAEAIRPYFEELLHGILAHGTDSCPDGGSELIFSGYGADQKYPSLVPVTVFGGIERHVSCSVLREEVVCISEERPVAICPFAQKDVIRAVLRGLHKDWSEYVSPTMEAMIKTPATALFSPPAGETMPDGLGDELWTLETEDIEDRFYTESKQVLDGNQHKWETALKDYDLEEMASLADCLINLTGLQRMLTFSTEGVGGTVDLAVISRTDGFTWLRRKNWYHKDNGLGI